MKLFSATGIEKLSNLLRRLEDLQDKNKHAVAHSHELVLAGARGEDAGLLFSNEIINNCIDLIHRGSKEELGQLYKQYNDLFLIESVAYIDSHNQSYFPGIFNRLSRDLSVIYLEELRTFDLKSDMNDGKIFNILKSILNGKDKIITWLAQSKMDLQHNIAFYDQCAELVDRTATLSAVDADIKKNLLEAARNAVTPENFKRVKSECDIYLLTALQSKKLVPSFAVSCLELEYQLNLALKNNPHFKKSALDFITSTYHHLNRFLTKPDLVQTHSYLAEAERNLSSSAQSQLNTQLYTTLNNTLKGFKEYVDKLLGNKHKKKLIKSLGGQCSEVMSTHTSSIASTSLTLLALAHQALCMHDEITREEKSAKGNCETLLVNFSQAILEIINQINSRPTLTSTASLMSGVMRSDKIDFDISDDDLAGPPPEEVMMSEMAPEENYVPRVSRGM